MEQKLKIFAIVPKKLKEPLDGDKKGICCYLDALGKISQLTVIADVESEADDFSFRLRPIIFSHRPFKRISKRNAKIIYEQIQKDAPDVIILEQPFLGWMGQVSKSTGVPFFLDMLSIEYLRIKSVGRWWWMLMYGWERWAMTHSRGAFFATNQDRLMAIKKFKLNPERAFLRSHGFPQTSLPVVDQNERAQVLSRHGINPNNKVFMFFGVLKYLSSLESLSNIINEISPRLKAKLGGGYTILICGGGLAPSFQKSLQKLECDNIVYAGFVPNIDEYIRSSDVVMNPVVQYGGIKTKVIEAIGQNRTVVSTISGIEGIDAAVCGDKLKVVTDNDWDMFVNCMIDSLESASKTTQEFYDKYSIDGIAKDIYNILNKYK